MLTTNTPRTLGRANVLVEGIDGSGKDEFVKRLVRILKGRFVYTPEASLSVVGQPAFCFDDTNLVRALIERGEARVSLEETIQCLSENRRQHEAYLARYSGVVICLRGVITELATLARLFGNDALVDLGQARPIDLLVVIDADPVVARKRILGRERPPDWRESPENLVFFRRFFLEVPDLPFVRRRLVFQNIGALGDLDRFAGEVADELERCWA